MPNNEPFGFDPEDLDRIFPGASDQLRGALNQIGRMFDSSGGNDPMGRSGRAARRPGRRRSRRPRARPATASG